MTPKEYANQLFRRFYIELPQYWQQVKTEIEKL
jgi:hypothetical protein